MRDPSNLQVIMLCEFFWPFDRGGSEWSVYHLASSLAKRGHTIYIFTPNYGAATFQKKDGLTIIRFPFLLKLRKTQQEVTPFWHSNLIWWLLTIFFLFFTCVKLRPSHIHIQGKYFLPAAIIVGKLLGIPVVTTLRDYIILCPFAYCINKQHAYKACSFLEVVLRDGAAFALGKHYKGYREVITSLIAIRGWMVSQVLKFFLKYSSVVVAISKKVSLIYEKNGIKVTTVIYNSAPFRTNSFKKPSQYILYVGRLTSGKGLPLLLDSYHKLQKKVKLPQLLFVGEGPLQKQIKSQYPTVKLLGHITHNLLQYYYSHALFLVVSSTWEEPFGRVALESLSYGVPVVVTEVGGLPEIIKHLKTGIVASPTTSSFSQALQRALMSHKKFRAQIKLQYPQLKYKFEERPVTQYETIYRNYL